MPMANPSRPYPGSSLPYTQPSPIVIDDDEDEDVVFVPSGLANSSSNQSRLNGTLADATADMHLDPQPAPISAYPGSSLSVSSAIMGAGSSIVVPSQARSATQSTERSSSSTRYVPVQSSSSRSSSSRTSHAADKFQCGLIYDANMMLHANPIDLEHPEAPERINKIFRLLQKSGCASKMKRIDCREVRKEEVQLVHDVGLWEGLERSADLSREVLAQNTLVLERLDSLYINEHSALCARLSCGGAIELCDAIASGRVHNGFAIVRPPGHHAEPHKSMGFCFYNNVAVATRFLQDKYRQGPNKIQKVLILDWDVHHGNGTQRAFEDDADVLYISLHRYEDGSFYPGGEYGGDASVGSGLGEGKSVNIPWPAPGMGDKDYLHAFQQVVMPIAREFCPDFVIISAGFDAAEGDPIGGNLVSPTGYALMTYLLASLVHGRLAVILEGGYNVDAIAASALEVTKVILREPPPRLAPKSTVQPLAAAAVNRVAHIQSRYWKSIIVPPIHSRDTDQDDSEPTVRITQLLRAHRKHTLLQTYDLEEIPIPDTFKEYSRGPSQAFCSPDILEQKTVVLFAHDMGNLRAELPTLNSTPNGELGYIIDSSKLILDWAHGKGYGIIDVNVLFELPDSNLPRFNVDRQLTTAKSKAAESYAAISKLLEYLADNIVSMGSATEVVLIGHGFATKGIMDLIAGRPQIQKKVAAVVMVMGLNPIPQVSAEQRALRKWYWKKSKVITPELHPIWLEPDGPSRRMGKVEASPEVKAVRVLSASMDGIATFIDQKLGVFREPKSPAL